MPPAGGLLPFFGVVLAALPLAGMGKTVFDPALRPMWGNGCRSTDEE